jgi:C4-dicarboxylate-specific signal transduction histidine kinase
VLWRTPHADLLVGCTRYPHEPNGWLLVMSEISQKQMQLTQRMNQHRLEVVTNIVAITAHELRSPLSSIVFNGDVLAARLDELSRERLSEIAEDLCLAAGRMRDTIACLSDYVGIGPPIASNVKMQSVLERVHSLVRPRLRSGGHRLIAPYADERVIGNSIAIEQIIYNLVVNAIESRDTEPVVVHITCRSEAGRVWILVEDDGSGILADHQPHVFEPFYTTKAGAAGIGLTAAREAARVAGGDVELVASTTGASFAVWLPAAEAVS